MRICLIKCLLLFAVFPALASSNGDIVQSLLMKQSNIEYHETNQKGLHQILLSSPKRINNEIIIDKDVRQAGDLQLVMTSLPSAKKAIDGFEYYRSLLLNQGNLLYQCSQRACGVSSVWANDILDDRDLTGRDSDQYYVAGTIDHGGNTYLLSVYLVANALRHNLAFLSIIKKDEVQTEWYNGLFVRPDSQLPQPLLLSIRDQLIKNESLILYVASYTNKEKFSSVKAMQKLTKYNFLKAQEKLSSDLNIAPERIKEQFVGSFHEQVIDGGGEAWLRLFLFKP